MTPEWRVHCVLGLNFILVLSLEMSGTSELFVFTENFNVTTNTVGQFTLALTIPRLICSAWISPAIDATTSSWMLIVSLMIVAGLRLLKTAAIAMHWLPGLISLIAAGGAFSMVMDKRMTLLLEHVITQHSAFYSLVENNDPKKTKRDRELLMGKIMTRRYSLNNAAMALADVFYFLLRYYEITVQQANVFAWFCSFMGLFLTSVIMLYLQPMLQHVEDVHTATLGPDKKSETPPDPFCGFSCSCCAPPPPTGGEKVTFRENVKLIWENAKDPLAWRMVTMQIILQGSYSVFGYIKIGLSTVLLHFYGDRVPFPLVEAINPTMVMLFSGVASFVIPTTWSSYTLILLGTCVAPLSLIPVIISPTKIWSYVYFIIIFSMGEVIWSPRVDGYILAKAPRHKQATFLALVSIPVSIVSLAISQVTYWLTHVYCSKESSCQEASHLWVIVFLGTLITPIGLFLFRKWLQRSPQEDRIQAVAAELAKMPDQENLLPNPHPM